MSEKTRRSVNEIRVARRAGREGFEDERRRRGASTALVELSMRGRFGSPIFGPEHFQAHPLRPLQTRPPPRIELSVQISILTANLPANSPLLLVSPSPSRVLRCSLFVHRRCSVRLDADSFFYGLARVRSLASNSNFTTFSVDRYSFA